MVEDRKQRIDRVNVAIGPSELAALDLVIAREGVTLTEAVRRLVTYGDFVYRTVRVAGASLAVKEPDGTYREVVVL